MDLLQILGENLFGRAVNKSTRERNRYRLCARSVFHSRTTAWTPSRFLSSDAGLF